MIARATGRRVAVVLMVASSAWLGLTALLELDARLFDGRGLGWLDSLFFRLVMGGSSPTDSSAQESYGFLIMCTTIFACAVFGLSSLGYLLLRWRRAPLSPRGIPQ